MKGLPLNRHTVVSRLDEIQRDLEKLHGMERLALEEFKEGENFAIAEHYLRRALEAVFEIGAHILARLPGKRASGYKEIALFLGERSIVPPSFAKETLVRMAGYRNRLTHYYSEVTEDEMYAIIRNRLDDFSTFSRRIKEVVSSPEQFGLTIEES